MAQTAFFAEQVRPVPPLAALRPQLRPLFLLGVLWAAIFAGSLFSPPLLDDADATHAQAALGMLHSGDWVTLRVDGIRYLEKPPLPYWITALSLRLFGINAFIVHLPLALTVLALCTLAYVWANRAFGSRAALYAGAFLLTAAGTFLFTRVFIPDALLALLLAFSLYATLRALEHGCPRPRFYAWSAWIALAASVLTKGLVAPFFYLGAVVAFLTLTKQWRYWRRLFPVSGLALFFLFAAPWHILAGLRNTGGAGGHGFFWFYFVNEHVLRFLGRRIPRDYNKLPAILYWGLHLVWLFPWSFFLPTALLIAWRERRRVLRCGTGRDLGIDLKLMKDTDVFKTAGRFGEDTVLLLALFSALVLIFFSLSTNQEYYTLPVYLPVLMLLAAALVCAEGRFADPSLRRTVSWAHGALTVAGATVAATLAYGLWSARHLPFVADIGSLLAHRGVGDYTLSMSHFFDLTGPSFAALRLPAVLAALAFLAGPAWAWRQRRRHRDLGATLALALTAGVFLVAAHIALGRFAPMLSSAGFAGTIQRLEQSGLVERGSEVLLYGDQAYGSSIPFYLDRQVRLVDGRSTSMLFGSTFRDAPPIFLTHDQLAESWGRGRRKLLFVPLEKRDEVDHLLGPRQIVLSQSSGKALVTDRPLLPGPYSTSKTGD